MKNYTIWKAYLLFALVIALSVKFGIHQNDLVRSRADDTKQVTVSPVPVQYAQVAPEPETSDTVKIPDSNEPVQAQNNAGLLAFLVANWLALLIGLGGFIEVIVRLTPTKKDDSILAFIKNILDSFIPNRRIGGGTHD